MTFSFPPLRQRAVRLAVSNTFAVSWFAGGIGRQLCARSAEPRTLTNGERGAGVSPGLAC